MTTAKESALGIAEALADAESAVSQGNPGEATDALETLHKRLRAGLYAHGEALGLTDDDIAEIDNHGPQRRGGEPKEK